MRQVIEIMSDVYEAREDFDEALEGGIEDEITNARTALLFLLDEYFDATADDVRPTLNRIPVAPSAATVLS